MTTRAVALAALSMLAVAATSLAAEGIRGRAGIEGQPGQGVDVGVYPYRPGGFGPLTGVTAFAHVRTGADGAFEVAVPPGRYVVEALKKEGGNRGQRPEAGDLHCLHSGSPVTVAPGAWTAVGLNLVRVPKEARRKSPDGQSSIKGRLTLGGKNASRVYLYLYDEVSTAFHGPARLLQPVEAGTFRIRVPPGTYFLVARKRARGGAYGPIETGDLFNFYARNPVLVAGGEEVSLEIPLVERLSQLEEDPGAFQGVQIRVTDPAGKAAPGYYVLAYPTAQRSGPPLATSARTDVDGRTRLPLRPGETVHLRARKTLGGPLEADELRADASLPARGRGELTLRLAHP